MAGEKPPATPSQTVVDGSASRRRRSSKGATGDGGLADRSSEKSETSPPSSGEGTPLKPYNFRRQSKQVSYVSRQEEEEEESLSEGSSEKDWLPEQEESDAEEEEDTEEMQVEEEEGEETMREEESEVNAGPVQAEPQKKNCPKTVRSYRCPECNREFSNSSNMQKHLRIHQGKLPFGCHVCGKSYSDPSNLTKHQLVHMGERRHPCPICPKAFYVKNQLDAHMRRHQGIRPFACLECRSTFCSRVDLLTHMKIHVVAKGRQPLLRCTDCNKTFAGPRLLRCHQKRHKNLVCEDCGEVFAFKFKYKFHRSLHATCVHCGVNYIGTHLCPGAAKNNGRPGRAPQKTFVVVPQGGVAKRPVGNAARAGSQPVGSSQAVTRPSETNRPSVSASSQLPTDCQVRPSDLASTMSLKAPSQLTPTDVGTCGPLIPAAILVLDQRRTQPSSLAETPLQLNPASVLLKDVPITWPVTSTPAVASPFVHTPPLPQLPGLVTLPSQSQASVAFPVLAAAPPVIVPLTDSHPMPLTAMIPTEPPQLSGSNPASGAGNNGLVLPKPATLPAGSQSKPLTTLILVGPSGSTPASGTTNNGLILLNTASLPAGSQTKLLTIPNQVGQSQPLGSNPVSGVANKSLILPNLDMLPASNKTKPLTVPNTIGSAQLSVSSRVSGAADNSLILPNTAMLPAGCQIKPVTVPSPMGPLQPSSSNTVSGAANNCLLLMNLATLPTDAKIILEIPSPTIIPPVTAQTCAICQAKYIGTHQCKKLLPNSEAHCEPIPETTLSDQQRDLDELYEETEREIKALIEFWENSFVDEKEDSCLEIPRISERSEEEEPRMCQLDAKGRARNPSQAFPVHPSCLQVQEQREPLAKSQATYSRGDGEEFGGDTGRNCEVTGSEEAKFPVANKHLTLPVENQRKLRRTRRHKSHYMCNICDKRFVYQRSFKNHMRMHKAFARLLPAE